MASACNVYSHPSHALSLQGTEDATLSTKILSASEWFSTGSTKQTSYTDHSTNKTQVLGHHVLKVVGDEDAAHVELDGVHPLAIVVEHVKGGALGDEEDGFEGHLTLGGEVDVVHGVLTLLADGLVEILVLLCLHLCWPATGTTHNGVTSEQPFDLFCKGHDPLLSTVEQQ